MNVAIVTQKIIRSDGQGRVNCEIAAHALRQGVGVHLIASEVDSALLAQGATWTPVRPKTHPVALFKGAEFAWRASRAVERIGSQIDVVNANGHTLNCPHTVNAVHFVHSTWKNSTVHTAHVRRDLYGAYQWVYTLMNSRWERQAFAQARTVVAVSNKVRRDMTEIGVDGKKIRVIHVGVDLEKFHPGAEDRAALGLPSGKTLALFVGELRTPRKNLDTVLQALSQTPHLELVVVGNKKASPYPEMAGRLGVADRTHFLGFRNDVERLMRATDLFVFPSRYEACSGVILEALASGLPVVTAETAGGAEIVTPDCGVVLADPDDVGALTQVLQTLLSDATALASLGHAARAVAQAHSREIMAESYLRLFEEHC